MVWHYQQSLVSSATIWLLVFETYTSALCLLGFYTTLWHKHQYGLGEPFFEKRKDEEAYRMHLSLSPSISALWG